MPAGQASSAKEVGAGARQTAIDTVGVACQVNAWKAALMIPFADLPSGTGPDDARQSRPANLRRAAFTATLERTPFCS